VPYLPLNLPLLHYLCQFSDYFTQNHQILLTERQDLGNFASSINTKYKILPKDLAVKDFIFFW